MKLIPIAPDVPNTRALILPGGGMRVAYQAGIVKALYNRGLRFSFADGASGGTMNLAALLGGLTPDELCRRWRTLDVTAFVSPRPLSAYARFPNTGALGDFDSILSCVFPHLGIDARKVRGASGVKSTFNVCDFDDKVVHAIAHQDMAEELLLAAISLPLATPPLRWKGRTWTDAVWIRDCNLMAAVEAGANELWVAWCIGNTPEYKEGLLEQYVHMIEIAAVGRLNEELAAIALLNEQINAGDCRCGHDRPIVVHVIKPEIPLPLDPDFLTGKIDAATLIAYGYRDAERYLETDHRGGTPLNAQASKMREPGSGVQFREVMSGRVTFGESDPIMGYRSEAASAVALHATIDVENMQKFIIDPRHEGGIAGHVELHRRGGWLPVARGVFGLFTPSSDEPDLSLMVYAGAISIDGKPHWFNGRKHVRIGPVWKMWKETTTLYVTVHEGSSAEGSVVAAGVLKLGVTQLLALLSTFHSTGGRRRSEKLGAIWRFFRFFASELIRHYMTGKPR